MQNLRIQIKPGDKTVHLKQNGLVPGEDYLCVEVSGRGPGKEYVLLNSDGRLVEVPVDKALVMGVWPEQVEINGMTSILQAVNKFLEIGKDALSVSDKQKGPAKKPATQKPKAK